MVETTITTTTTGNASSVYTNGAAMIDPIRSKLTVENIADESSSHKQDQER